MNLPRFVITSWPGAAAKKVEELITDLLEKVIAEIAEVSTIESISRVGLSVIQVTADDRVTDTDQVWDEVRAKVGPPLYDRIIGWSLDRKGVVLGGVSILFLGGLALIPVIGSQFFPSGLRDQFFVKVWLPEGAPITETSRVAKEVESILVELSPITEDGVTRQRLANVITFVATGGPRLMITQEPEYDYPYYAFLLVNTTDAAYTAEYAADVRRAVAKLHQARVTVDLYMLGPPIRDPVAFRLSGQDSTVLRSKARAMIRLFKETPATLAPYSNWGTPGYQIDVNIDPHAANLAGVTNADVALTIRSLLSGAQLTTYREGDHRVPVMLRTLREKRQDVNDLSGIYVNGASGRVPLDSIARVVPTWKPSVIARRNGLPTVTVGSRVEEGCWPTRSQRGSNRGSKQCSRRFQPAISSKAAASRKRRTKRSPRWFEPSAWPWC